MTLSTVSARERMSGLLALDRWERSGATSARMCFSPMMALMRDSRKDADALFGIRMHWFTARSTSTKRAKMFWP